MDYRIKFNHIGDLADARFAASVQATWFGFSVGYSSDLAIHVIQDILNWCQGGKLCLQLHPDVELETVINLCSVLPVEGLECNSAQFATLDSNVNGIHFLINDSNNQISTTNTVQDSMDYNTVEELDARRILNNNISSFSINCMPTDLGSVGEKDHEEWYIFFEELGIF